MLSVVPETVVVADGTSVSADDPLPFGPLITPEVYVLAFTKAAVIAVIADPPSKENALDQMFVSEALIDVLEALDAVFV